ncbi:MAG: gluconate 2-dehydrogenase subunit 3 family protein [Saprospiraceae bacterium]|nr:gluconate 2-dehydrogenase subunit 3 family protein [Saprospiraceae bacterium]
MKRRDALQQTGLILTSAVFGSGLMAALAGCASEANLPDDVLVFDLKQYKLTRALGDTILPRTDSPAASDVKVTEFIDLLLHDVYDDATRDQFLSGIGTFDSDCQQVTGKSFLELSEEERYKYLVDLDEDVISKNYTEKIPFYLTFKTLCVSVYYSTEAGIKQNLAYTPVPGGFDGDVPLRSGDLIEVGNEM